MVELVRIGKLLLRQAAGGPGVGVDNILLEDSCNLLQEDGTSVFLLE